MFRQEVCSLYLTPKIYKLPWYQKNILLLPCKVHTEKFIYKWDCMQEIISGVFAISAGRYETGVFHFGLATMMYMCSRTNVEMRHITLVVYIPNSLCSGTTICLSKLFIQTVWALTCTSSVLYSQVVFKSWFISQYFILTSTLLMPWFIARLREPIQIKYCLPNLQPFPWTNTKAKLFCRLRAKPNFLLPFCGSYFFQNHFLWLPLQRISKINSPKYKEMN